MATHLRKHHTTIPSDRRKTITKAIQDIPGIVANQAGLVGFQYPPPTVDPIPFIGQPQTDGLRCNECGFIVRTPQGIQRHCRKQHGWENDWRKGGNMAKRAREEREVPWTTGVRCQRFFRSRAASQWFEVGRGRERQDVAGTAETEDGETEETVTARMKEVEDQKIMQAHQTQAKRFEARRKQAIQMGDEKAEPNAWLERVGWAEHLKGLDPDVMRATVGPIHEDETGLRRMWESLERVMERARATVAAMHAGHAVLFEINRKEVHVKPRKPFDGRMEEDTWARYKDVFQKLICFIRRTDDRDENRPPYEFTNRQGKLYDEFVEAAQGGSHVAGEPSDTVQEQPNAVRGQSDPTREQTDPTREQTNPAREQTNPAEQEAYEARVDRLCLDFMVALFDHPLKHTHYENAIISGLAVMGLREDGGWVSAENYTPIYSAVIKMARILVAYQAVVEQKDEIQALARSMDEEDAAEAA